MSKEENKVNDFDSELAMSSFKKSLDEREFFSVGYLKSLGILIFTLLGLLASVFYSFYGNFIYEPPVSYLALNKQKQMLEEVSLKKLHISITELEQWTNDATLDIMDWNYLSFDTHGVKVSKYFFDSETPLFMENFNNLYLQKIVKSQKAIVIPEVIELFKVEKDVIWKERLAYILKGSILLKIYGKEGVKTMRYYITVAVARETFSNKQDGLSILKIDFNTERT